jgi:hypothetical protein
MPEFLLTRFFLRRLYNLWPCYWGTGVRLKHIAKDFREMRLEVPLNWRTRNYVGTIFGGSMYGAVDLTDDEGTACATVEKTIHIRRN